ncbi:DUF4012 domain-containing protein [Planotetraspora mira]|uniref:DUF4012 domain-containing protein n=1 Tax=Planotetraspora mira TaxID=58121 RepID=A0A8J3X4Q2_9ACTN|nr:DUF4012 domain-containing protein [Planotetraspora mira]GII27306.1 hypothetical protein Pmi06nite_07480 [Planotetraspora mira]
MRSRKRRLLVIGLPALGLGLTLAGGWTAYRGLSVRDHLEATRTALLRLSAGDPASLGEGLADAQWHAAEARRLTGGLDWSLIAHAPVVGDGATTVRGLAEAAAELTDVLAGVHRAGAPFITGNAPSLGNLRRLLAGIDAAAPVLDDAASRLATVRSSLAETPASTGLDVLDGARGTALREVDRLRGWLGDAATAAALLPPMLGHDGPRRYFLAFQTNAEARGTGGLVGAFGILKAGRGRLAIERLSPNNDLPESSHPAADNGQEFRSRYGPGATSTLSVSNLSPHFPYAATTWTGLWERQTGQRLDGAIATDPIGLAYLLELIGPVRLPGGETVTAGNVVDLTERAAYARYQDPGERKRFLIQIAGAVSEALIRSRPEPARLLPVLSRLVGERRIQIWSRWDAEEQRLATAPVGGVLPEQPGPFAGLVINNSAGSKLDYYLERSVTYNLGGCGSGGLRSTRVRIRLANDVPQGRLPTYVTDRLDSPERPHTVGSNLLWVSLYAGVGTRVSAARLDGHPTGIITEVERSHPVYSTLLEFAPRQSRTLEFDLLEPSSAAAPVVPVQPLVRPQHTQIIQDRQGCAP